MVATDQEHFSIQAVVQVSEIRLQALGEPEWAVDQISEDDHSFWIPPLTELLQTLQCAPVVITWKWNSAGLEHLCLTKMQIGNKEFFTGWSPDGFLSQQNQLFVLPLPATMRNGFVGMGCWLAISLIAVVFNVDGSQQWNGSAEICTILLAKHGSVSKACPPFIGLQVMASQHLRWQPQKARAD